MPENAQAVSLGCGPGGPGHARGDAPPQSLCRVSLSAGGIGCVGRDKGQVRKCLDAVEIYNPDGDFWREGPPMPTPLLSLRSNSTSAGTVDGKLYVCGGFHGAGTHWAGNAATPPLTDPTDNPWGGWAERLLQSGERRWNFWPPEEGNSIQGQ